MKKYINGKLVDLTHEEIAAMQKEQARAEAYERKRELSAEEITAMLIREKINDLSVDDATAYRMRAHYPTFEELVKRKVTAKDAGYKFRHGGDLYKTAQPNIAFVAHYPPGTGMESMYTRIDETHDGSEFDPVPYDGNMALTAGLYYTQDGGVYICTRNTVNPVYAALSELVGLYVERGVNE